METTPLTRYAQLESVVGNGKRIWIKHEDRAPLGCFKTRNVLSALTKIVEQHRHGLQVVAASTGNHGIALAWVSGLLGIRSTVFVSTSVDPLTIQLIRYLGAEVSVGESNYDDSRNAAIEYAQRKGAALIEATENLDVICGAATITVEVVKELPVDFTMFVSVGGGSQAAGALSVAKYSKRSIGVIGVQTYAAPAVYESWRQRRPIAMVPSETIAGGLATGHVYQSTFAMLCDGLQDFLLVDEEDLSQAIGLAAKYTGSFLSGAGAAALAGFLKSSQQVSTKDVVIVFSGAAMVDLSL